MVASETDAILIKVAALGLTPDKHLGRTIKELADYLIQLEAQFGCNPCGEGGEFETLVLDCPLFSQRIVIDTSEIVHVSRDSVCPVAFLNPLTMHLEEKADFDLAKSHKDLLLPYASILQESIAKSIRWVVVELTMGDDIFSVEAIFSDRALFLIL